jgi:hypothetical protein
VNRTPVQLHFWRTSIRSDHWSTKTDVGEASVVLFCYEPNWEDSERMNTTY